ncbi:MAG: cytochrome b/b6 domain-containing protein [Bacteroidales bacterium]|nr:cytochrome b/b6 domain-containing protein [Bacteroidales bacterium]
MKKIYIYRKFERFWHWTQAFLILFLAFTGFEIHSSFELFGYQRAVFLHNNAAWFYFILLIAVILWIFFTGEWRQYVPKREHIKQQVEFYMKGIFKGEEHPVCKTISDKFNDLQRATYFFLEFFLVPLMVLTGMVYMKYNYIHDTLNIHFELRYLAYVHTAIAFFLVGFVIIHIYLTTTGYKPLSAIKAMVTGWEEMSNEEATVALREYLNYSINRVETKIITSRGLKDTETFDSVFENVACNLGVSNSELQDRLHRSQVGYFKINAEGYYVEVNKIWKELYGCTEIDDPIGKNYILDRTGEDKDDLEYVFDQVINKGRTLSGIKIARICKDGTRRFHTISVSPVKLRGKIVGMEGYIIDFKEEIVDNKE